MKPKPPLPPEHRRQIVQEAAQLLSGLSLEDLETVMTDVRYILWMSVFDGRPGSAFHDYMERGRTGGRKANDRRDN